MGDYFGHWLKMQQSVRHLPAIFHVNWFRKSADGKFLWPGFGENMRVLKWIVDRVRGRAAALESAIGWVPAYEDLEWSGLDFSKEQFEQVMALDREAWARELNDQEELFNLLRARLPAELIGERQLVLRRL